MKRTVSAQQNRRDFRRPRAMSDNEIDVRLYSLEALGHGPSRRIEIDADICDAAVLPASLTPRHERSMPHGR
jgi:hypothetical protein